MKIQVIGIGCPKCKQLEAHVTKAAQELGLLYELEKITNVEQITALGVMVTPALAIDGKVKITGQIPSVNKLIEILKTS